MTFGQLLEKLLYLSNQKKIVLAKELGYDISYISKWVNGKNIPTQKNISNICKMTSNFIVNSLTESSKLELKEYFEINTEIDNDDELKGYLEYSLKDSYVNTVQKNIPSIYEKNNLANLEDNYNSTLHINPRLRKQYLAKYAEMFIEKSENMEIIIYVNLYSLNNADKMAISNMKKILHSMSLKKNIKVSILMGFEGENDDIIFNTILIINMITSYSCMDFKLYNCDIALNSILSVIKGAMFHTAMFTKDKRCLFTNISRKKSIVDEAYNTLDDIRKSRGEKLVYYKNSYDIIKEKIWIQYIMGTDLRFLIGSINEFFMPKDLFEEISLEVFKEEPYLLDDLRQINMFLENMTYKSKMKVLIYEKELIRYMATGEIHFFNRHVKLNIHQMQKHINYIKNIIANSNNINIKLVEDGFVELFKNNKNPSLYLSRDLKILKMHPEENIYDYSIVRDNKFKIICDDFFDTIWTTDDEVLVCEKDYILEKIDKALMYAKIMNDN